MFYLIDAVGATDDGKSSTMPMMYQWSGSFPLKPGKSQSTICEGELQTDPTTSTTYCSQSLIPKVYTQR